MDISSTPENRVRYVRARLKARRKCQPGDDLDALADAIYRDMPPSAEDARMAAIVTAAPKPADMHPDFLRELRRLWNSKPQAS